MPKAEVEKEIKNERRPSAKKYFYAVGRRKTAVATIRLMPGKGKIEWNGQEKENLPDYILDPLVVTGLIGKFDLQILTRGGGYASQCDAIKLALARALVLSDESLKPSLRKADHLTRDPREKERKKPGLKRARKAPQWQKR